MITRLSDIIDTGSQADVLAFFITATPRSFSVSELMNRLEVRQADMIAALESLEKQNLLKTFAKNRTRFYLLNQRHAMIPQIKESFKGEHKQWPDELVRSLKKLGNLSEIFLSGVFVGRPELAVDLLLVGNVNASQLDQFLRDTSKQFGGELNYSIMSAQEFVMRRDTFDRFIKDIFDYPHIVLLDNSDAPAKPREAKPKPVSKPKPVAKPKTIAKPKAVTKAKPKPTPKPPVKKPVVKHKPVVKPKLAPKPAIKPVQKKKITKTTKVAKSVKKVAKKVKTVKRKIKKRI